MFYLVKKHFKLLSFLLLAPGYCAAQGPPSTADSKTLATVNGQPITEDDLVPSVQSQLRPLRDQEYQIKRKALDNLISQKLLEAEAKKKGISTAEELLKQEVDSKIPEATDPELNAIYAIQKEQLGNRTFQDVKAQLSQNLKKARVQQGRQEYTAHLREQSKVAILLGPPRTEVGFDPTRVRGNPKAKVMIVEFSDFQCPYCREVEPTLKNVLAKYKDTVALAFRDMPIQQLHPLAPKAAEAARCAGEQGKFWEYHDLLFADPSKLDQSGLMDQACTLKLDEKQFASCLSSEKYKTQVQQDSQDGMRAGVTGTPAFFINGVLLSGSQPLTAFESVIQEQLSLLPATSK